MKFYIIACCWLYSSCQLYSQTFSGHPPGLHWQKLKTEQGNIFFPKSIESKAYRVAHTIKHFYDTDTTLGRKRFKINIVLQNQTVQSNGYVGIGPLMSEFYLTPPHDPYLLGPIDWTRALAIHEYRHVIQAMNSRIGINNILYHLLGEEAWGASYGFTIPNWFAEGDAVNAETKYSNAGRGRLPSFISGFRALNQGKTFWTYQKARNGSYQHLVPNHYVFGYTMVKYINDHYGQDQWNHIFNEAVKYHHPVFPFKSALKKYTGLNVNQLYNLAIGELRADSLDHELRDEVILKNNQKHIIKNFITPQALQDGRLLYLESSYNQLPTLFTLSPDQHKTRLTNLGISTDPEYTMREPLVCLTELTTDPRWDARDYSDIILYNIKSNLKRKLTHHQKYFRPSLSHDLTKIACLEALPDGSHAVAVLDTRGILLQRVAMPAGSICTFPVFKTGDSSIFTILRKDGYASIYQYSLFFPSVERLIPPIAGIISNLQEFHDTVYFSSDLSGRDNLYALDLRSKKVFQLTDNSVGIQQYHVNGSDLWYNYQTSSGIQIRKKKLNDCLFKPVLLDSIQREFNTELEERLSGTLTGSTLSKASNLNNPFRIYSWTVRPDEGGNTFRILGRNVFNTVSGTLAYAYQLDEKSHTLSNTISLGMWYPILSATTVKTFGRNISKLKSPGVDSIRWNETGFRVGLSIPWQYYVHNQVIRVQPLIQYGFYHPDYLEGNRKNYQTTQYVRSGIILSSQQRQARQQVSSRFAQTLTVQWNIATNNKANSLDILTSLHLPGLGKNHSLELNMDIHRQTLSDPYRFSNPTRFISGYESFSSDRSVWKRLAYHLPLWYPDRGIQGILFIKRIRTRLFAEEMLNTFKRSPKNRQINYKSVGSEVLFDGNLVNTLPVSLGARYSQRLDNDLISGSKQPRFEFIIESLF